MKSREYLSTINGLVYWLEEGAVMMRKPGDWFSMQSNMSAADFFKMVGNDTLTLIEGNAQ